MKIIHRKSNNFITYMSANYIIYGEIPYNSNIEGEKF